LGKIDNAAFIAAEKNYLAFAVQIGSNTYMSAAAKTVISVDRTLKNSNSGFGLF
jgi:hypothetical protein